MDAKRIVRLSLVVIWMLLTVLLMAWALETASM